MTTQVTPFQFNTSTIRVVTLEGNPWFVAAEVCEALHLGWDKANGVYAPSRLVRSLDASEKASNRIANKGHAKTIISESGLYKLIMRCDKPEAKTFQDWVTKEVLPAIRKDGAYIQGEEKVRTGEMSEDEFVLKAMSILQAKVGRLTEERDRMAQENAAEDLLRNPLKYLDALMGQAKKLQEENLKLAQGHSILLPKSDAFDTVMEDKLPPLTKFVRTLKGVNAIAIKRSLKELGYRQSMYDKELCRSA